MRKLGLVGVYIAESRPQKAKQEQEKNGIYKKGASFWVVLSSRLQGCENSSSLALPLRLEVFIPLGHMWMKKLQREEPLPPCVVQLSMALIIALAHVSGRCKYGSSCQN